MFELPEHTVSYLGPNRRNGRERRVSGTRREEFRFEPGKADRRNGRDRRKHGGWDVSTALGR